MEKGLVILMSKEDLKILFSQNYVPNILKYIQKRNGTMMELFSSS